MSAAFRWGVVLRLRGVRLFGLSASLWGEQVISYVASGIVANPGRSPGVSRPDSAESRAIDASRAGASGGPVPPRRSLPAWP